MLGGSHYNALLTGVLAASLVFFAGCAKPPAQEIESADKAVAEAKLKEADLYVQDIFAKAEETLKRAKSHVDEKKYREAKALAEEALSIAQQATALIESKKEEMKADALQRITDVQKSLGELKSSVLEAFKKRKQIDREKIQGAIGGWEIDMVSVQEQMEAGKIRQAYDLLLSMQEQIRAQQEEMEVSAQTEAKKK